MGTSREEIREWIEQGKVDGATHLIVVCDTYDWEDYPVYVMPGQSAQKIYDAHNGPNMQKVMEVYNLSLDWEKQLNAGRVFNF